MGCTPFTGLIVGDGGCNWWLWLDHEMRVLKSTASRLLLALLAKLVDHKQIDKGGVVNLIPHQQGRVRNLQTNSFMGAEVTATKVKCYEQGKAKRLGLRRIGCRRYTREFQAEQPALVTVELY